MGKLKRIMCLSLALGEAIVGAAKAIGYESLKPEHLALAPTSLARCTV